MTHARPNTVEDLAQAVAELQARVDALNAWRVHQSDLLDEHFGPLSGEAPVDDDLDRYLPVETPPAPTLDGYAFIEWVHDTVAAVTARPLRGEFAWCPFWWEHPEAVFRFRALHGAWTELAAEPGAALSIWIRDHLDPCLQVLLSPTGPFSDCAHSERRTPVSHRPLLTLPTATPP